MVQSGDDLYTGIKSILSDDSITKRDGKCRQNDHSTTTKCDEENSGCNIKAIECLMAGGKIGAGWTNGKKSRIHRL
jgi:hypothetical protein